MKFWIGTSGFSYKEWKGNFYPENLPDKEMLRFYAERLPAVEINNTFYRMPKESVLATWAEQVPSDFRFVLKASQRITHAKRLKDVGDETNYLFRTAEALGDRLGMILFQLPPYLKKDVPRLQSFLENVPNGGALAFEFRHASWFDDEVYDVLRYAGSALCYSDAEAEEIPETLPAAPRGYLRLRHEDYSDDQLQTWLQRIHAQNWDEVFLFFKHEEKGAGPRLARSFLELAEGS